MTDPCTVPGCRNQADMTYLDRRICSSCFGKWEPETLDSLLNVRQLELWVLLLVPLCLLG